MARRRMIAVCLRDRCSYRRSDTNGKSFCMFPECPFGDAVENGKRPRRPTLDEIVAESRRRGLIP